MGFGTCCKALKAERVACKGEGLHARVRASLKISET